MVGSPAKAVAEHVRRPANAPLHRPPPPPMQGNLDLKSDPWPKVRPGQAAALCLHSHALSLVDAFPGCLCTTRFPWDCNSRLPGLLTSPHPHPGAADQRGGQGLRAAHAGAQPRQARHSPGDPAGGGRGREDEETSRADEHGGAGPALLLQCLPLLRAALPHFQLTDRGLPCCPSCPCCLQHPWIRPCRRMET